MRTRRAVTPQPIIPTRAKGARQPKAVPTKPASAWPTERPRPEMIETMLIACGRSPGGYMSPIKAKLAGIKPPMPAPTAPRQHSRAGKPLTWEFAKVPLEPTSIQRQTKVVRFVRSARRPTKSEKKAPTVKKTTLTIPPSFSSLSASLNPNSRATAVMLVGSSGWSATSIICASAKGNKRRCCQNSATTRRRNRRKAWSPRLSQANLSLAWALTP